MKNYLLVALFLLSLNSSGQFWCPNGSQWHYSFISMTSTGYVLLDYEGDSLVGDQIAQKLQKRRFEYYFLTSSFVTSDLTRELTYEENGVVFIRFNNQWDTLYNFNANVGEWWFMSGPSELLQSNIKLTVVGEGVKTINGENRNYKVIEGEAQFDFGLDTIVEGIGSINGYLHQFDTYIGQLDGNDAGSFRCYSNDNFELYQYPNALPCEFIVGLNELVEKPSFRCYPNPATNILNIVIEKPVERIEIFDSSGTLILTSTFQKSLDLSDLPRGFYLVKCSTKDNFETSKIVLE